MRLACNPLSWMNSDIPSLGAHIPVEQCLSEIALIGYEGVELEDPLRDGLAAQASMLRDRHLTLVAGWHGTEFLDQSFDDEMDRLREHIAYLKNYGARIVNIAEVSRAVHRDPHCPLSERPQLCDKEWRRLCVAMDTAAQLIAESGLVSAYHHHMGTVVQSSEDITRLMGGTRHLGLLFDTGHLVFAGADPQAVLTQHVSRITHVHAKNVRSERLQENLGADCSFPEGILSGVFTVPGDFGCVDFAPLVASLERQGYEGWLVMEAEQDPSVAHPLSYARLGYHALKLAMYQASLSRSSVGPWACKG